MRISEKQALTMFIIIKDAANIIPGVGGIKSEDIMKLVNDILHQQDEAPVELDVAEKESGGG